MHGSTIGSSRPRRPSNTMKNFVRLVQFAWRYKVRFGLSVACAAMVALLFFTEIGAVYPLLHILFGSQNPQRWISEKIVGLDTDIVVASTPARPKSRVVLDDLKSGQPRREPLNERYREGQSTNLRKRRTSCASMSAPVGVGDLRETLDPDVRNRDRLARKPAARPSRGRGAAARNCENLSAFSRRATSSRLSVRLREIQQRTRRQRETARTLQVGAALCQQISTRRKFQDAGALDRARHAGRGRQGLFHVPSGSARRRRDAVDALRHPQHVFSPHRSTSTWRASPTRARRS